MDNSLLTHIEAVVKDGKVAFSADDEDVVAIVQELIRSGRKASFYLSRNQARILSDLHWTPERVKASKLEPVSDEERYRIESELGIDNLGRFRFAAFQCSSGHTFGAFEFLRHGIQEHGADALRSIFGLKNAAFLRVNPHFVVSCPECDQTMEGGIEYEGDTYPGCSYPEAPVCV
ncbi:hypothetical protein ACFYQ5_22700 [Streptomyces sp. NPDC005794]|uniref:hypothetical protein n=1 Tax=Streptomyces sp. NPDC005794 TaxID=3364733 RepID=UPI0036768FA8